MSTKRYSRNDRLRRLAISVDAQVSQEIAELRGALKERDRILDALDKLPKGLTYSPSVFEALVHEDDSVI